MSYDLMVFSSNEAPIEPKAFMAWYSEQTKWTETHGYNDPNTPTKPLRGWFQEIIATFPPMNGPLSKEEDLDNPKTTDYSVGRTVIYAAFAWSEAEAAYRFVRESAQRHDLGFFDVSSSAVWLPGRDGVYKLAFYATRRPGPPYRQERWWTGAGGILSKIRKWVERGPSY